MKKLLFIISLVLVIGIIHDNMPISKELSDADKAINIELQQGTCMRNGEHFINNECYFK